MTKILPQRFSVAPMLDGIGLICSALFLKY